MLADLDEGASLADIRAPSGCQQAIAVKLLTTLEGLGIVWRDDVAQRYNLTYRISNLGSAPAAENTAARSVGRRAQSARRRDRRTGCVFAVVENGDRITWVYADLRRQALTADRSELFARCLPAHDSDRQILACQRCRSRPRLKLHAASGIKPMTRHTKVAIKAIRMELEVTKKRGFCHQLRGTELGVIAIAGADHRDDADRRARMRRRGQPRGADQSHERA